MYYIVDMGDVLDRYKEHPMAFNVRNDLNLKDIVYSTLREDPVARGVEVSDLLFDILYRPSRLDYIVGLHPSEEVELSLEEDITNFVVDVVNTLEGHISSYVGHNILESVEWIDSKSLLLRDID